MMEMMSYGTGLVTGFEGKPRMKARRCEGDKWEVGYGCTYYPDGRRVRQGDTITDDMVLPMLRHCMRVELAPILRALEREPNVFWVQALGSFGYNVGGHNAVSQRAAVITLFNEGREVDAAAAFVSWISATSAGPSDAELGDPYYAGLWEKRGDRNVWIGPDGQPCEYRRRMRGLLRRALAQGCVALGYDWEVACRNDAVFLERERIWDPGNRRWTDRVIRKTELKDVLVVARRYPLAPVPPVEDLLFEKEEPAAEAPPAALPLPPPVTVPIVAETLPEVPASPPPPPAKPPPGQIATPGKDPRQDPTFWTMMILVFGRIGLAAGVIPAAFTELILDKNFQVALAGIIAIYLAMLIGWAQQKAAEKKAAVPA